MRLRTSVHDGRISAITLIGAAQIRWEKIINQPSLLINDWRMGGSANRP